MMSTKACIRQSSSGVKFSNWDRLRQAASALVKVRHLRLETSRCLERNITYMATKIMARKYTDGYYYIWENGKRIAHSAYDEESAKSEAKRRCLAQKQGKQCK